LSIPSRASEEERLFVKREQQLGFSVHSPLQVLQVFERHQIQSDHISIAEFNAIARDLKLDVRELDLCGSPINRLYGQLGEKGMYDSLRLRTLAVLLSPGRDKAEAFFGCIAQTGVVSTAQVKSFFTAMVYVSGEVLPLLTASSDEEAIEGNSYEHEFVQSCVQRLQMGRDTLVERWTNLVTGGSSQITAEHFKASFRREEELSALRSPYKVRKALKKQAFEMSKPQRRPRPVLISR
jgi:hypothetical protein